MIELQHVNRIFRVGDQPVHALRDVCLRIEAGEYVSIMGPSGSGKSTLLNVAGLLDRPDSGRYMLDGKDVTSLDDYDQARTRREKIGFIFQFFHLIPRMSALENVELPMMLAGRPATERRESAERILHALALSNRIHHKPDQLSGGQRQRVAIARAAVMEPRVILADEPTGNLDRASGREVVEILEKFLEKQITLVVVTHDPDLGKRASRRLRMIDGSIISDSWKVSMPCA